MQRLVQVENWVYARKALACLIKSGVYATYVRVVEQGVGWLEVGVQGISQHGKGCVRSGCNRC